MKPLAAMLMLMLTIQLNAQKNDNRNKLIKEAQKDAAEINVLLEMIGDVSPFYNPEEVKEFIVDYEKFSPAGDVWEIIDSCNNGIIVLLRQFIENEKYAELKTDTMINTYKTYSSDGKIIIHNWYTNNGGTYMMHENIAEAINENGKKYAYNLDYAGNIFETGSAPAENGSGYYFIGTTKACGVCYEHTLMLFSLNENGLEPVDLLQSVNEETNYAFGTYFRGWDFDNNYISFNEVDHAFTYAHKNDDAEEEDIYYEEGRWVFDGNLFRQEITMQLGREEFENLFGESDNN